MKRVLALVISFVMAAGFAVTAAAANTPLVKPVYPKAAGYEDYDTQHKTEKENPITDEFQTSVNAFSYASASGLLSGQEENLMYSPASLYMALSLTAEGAKGATQSELLKMLQFPGRLWANLQSRTAICFGCFIITMRPEN